MPLYDRIFISIIHNQTDNLEVAIEYSKNSLKKSVKQKNYWGILFSSYWIWQHFRKLDDIDAALELFLSKIEAYENSNFQWGIIAICPRLASIYSFKGDIDKAVNYYQKRIFERLFTS